MTKWIYSLEERGKSGKEADLSKFTEKAKSFTERSMSAQEEIVTEIKANEVVSAAREEYSQVQESGSRICQTRKYY